MHTNWHRASGRSKSRVSISETWQRSITPSVACNTRATAAWQNLQQLSLAPDHKRQIVMAAISGQNTQVLVINNNSSGTRTRIRAGPTTSMAINLKVRLYLVEHFCPQLATAAGPLWLSAALSGGSIKRRLTYSTLSPPLLPYRLGSRMYNAINSCHFLKYLTAKQTGKQAAKEQRKGRQKKHKQQRAEETPSTEEASVAIIIIIIILIIMIMIIIKLLLFLLGQYFSFVAIGDRARLFAQQFPRHSYLFMYAPHPLECVCVCVCCPAHPLKSSLII